MPNVLGPADAQVFRREANNMGKPPKQRGLSSRERIATRVLTRLSRKRLPDHLAAPGTVHETPQIFQATVAGISELSNLNPTHAAYVYAHNMASELAERCTAWKEMSPFVKLISRAEDMYMPGGPPLSRSRCPSSRAGVSSTPAWGQRTKPLALSSWSFATISESAMNCHD